MSKKQISLTRQSHSHTHTQSEAGVMGVLICAEGFPLVLALFIGNVVQNL